MTPAPERNTPEHIVPDRTLPNRIGPEQLLPKRIPSLDGLRSVSIVLVFLGHFFGYRDRSFLSSALQFLAYSGVQIFFVISGFLITTLLLREHARSGRINLRAFYWRRTLRIFPAAYAFLAVLALTGTLGRWDLLHAATYLSSYFTEQAPWSIDHLWSLSVEEQFYWVWPVALVLTFPLRRGIAWTVMLAAPLLRLLYIHGLGWLDIAHYFPTVADSIAAGCLLALYYPSLQRRAAWIRHPAAVLAFAALALAARPLLSLTRDPALLFAGIVPLLMAACIFGAIEGRFSLLNNPTTAYVGALSYSLYLWQQPFARGIHPWTRLPLNLPCALCAALASYYLVERPFLTYRHRSHA